VERASAIHHQQVVRAPDSTHRYPLLN